MPDYIPSLMAFWAGVGAKVSADLLSGHLCKSDDPGSAMGWGEGASAAVGVKAAAGLFYRPWLFSSEGYCSLNSLAANTWL